MSGKRNPGTVQWEVWVTVEASNAINTAAKKLGITRGEYMQDALWRLLWVHTGKSREDLLPTPVHTNHRFTHLAHPKPGYKGRWSMWVRVRCTVHNSVPMLLTRLATEQGLGSASEFTRRALALALKRDTGLTVPMPSGRKPTDLFGGTIHEVVR
jgi:hypothetical protein